MTALWVGLFALGIGFGAGWWRFGTRRSDPIAVERRSRVLYELAEGDRESVAAELEQVCEAEPADASVFLALAAIDRRRGRVDRAKAIHRSVLASAALPAEQRVAALLGLGRDLLAQGNERAAVGALVRAISLAPRSTATLESLAQALEEARAWERAAAAWERLEKQVEGRRRRVARRGRGHAIAGQALDALAAGEEKKAARLTERAIDLAPDSGHVWHARANVESALGHTEDALEAWQRAWELSPAGAGFVIGEAWDFVTDKELQPQLRERMLATLRVSRHPSVIIELAEHLASDHAPEVDTALARISDGSRAAQLALVRTRLKSGAMEFGGPVREAALAPLAPEPLVCGACGAGLETFAFRCSDCGAWDRASSEGVAPKSRP